MKRVLFILAVGLAGGISAATYSAKSPDGQNEIRLDTEPALRVTILRRGQPRAEVRNISLDVEGRGVLGGANCKASDVRDARHDAVIQTPIYKRACIKDNGAGTCVSFGDWSVELHARNDGVAYRFATKFGGEITVKGETARLAFPSPDQKVWAAANRQAPENDPLQDSWEGVYGLVPVNEAPVPGTKKIWYAPITASYPDGVAMTITESDIVDYPGWNFARGGEPASLDPVFARYPTKTRYWTWGAGYSEDPSRYQRVVERADFLARTAGTRTFPWRVFVLADGFAQLPAADIVYALASPSKIGDASWVKPGKVAWDWWNCWNVLRPRLALEDRRRLVGEARQGGVGLVELLERERRIRRDASGGLQGRLQHEDVRVLHRLRREVRRGVRDLRRGLEPEAEDHGGEPRG